jgi:hypothetical protein
VVTAYTVIGLFIIGLAITVGLAVLLLFAIEDLRDQLVLTIREATEGKDAGPITINGGVGYDAEALAQQIKTGYARRSHYDRDL